MKLKHFENKGAGVFELILHGIIGEDVNGVTVAHEINILNAIGATEIVERVNSLGGSVAQGFGIVSSNLKSEVKLSTIGEGVADSIAAVILVSGDKGSRKMVPFGSMMIHNVSLGDVPLEKMEEGPDKESAIRLNDSIKGILSSNSNLSEDEVGALMDKETRFTAEEAKAAGFIDEILPAGKQPKFAENLTREDYMNVCKEFSAEKGQNNNKNKSKMKSVLVFLNLNEGANEESVLAAIKDLHNKAAEVVTLKAKVKGLEAEKKEISKVAAESDVQNCIDKGVFDVAKKEEMVNLAIDSPAAFKAITGSIKSEYVNVNDQLDSHSKGVRGTKPKTEEELAKEYQNMMEYDPQGLELLETTNKAKFDLMYNAWEKS